jgi:hypothetical protein
MARRQELDERRRWTAPAGQPERLPPEAAGGCRSACSLGLETDARPAGRIRAGSCYVTPTRGVEAQAADLLANLSRNAVPEWALSQFYGATQAAHGDHRFASLSSHEPTTIDQNSGCARKPSDS